MSHLEAAKAPASDGWAVPGASGPQMCGQVASYLPTTQSQQRPLGEGLAFHSNLIRFICPLAEHGTEQVTLALGQEVRSGDLIWS